MTTKETLIKILQDYNADIRPTWEPDFQDDEDNWQRDTFLDGSEEELAKKITNLLCDLAKENMHYQIEDDLAAQREWESKEDIEEPTPKKGLLTKEELSELNNQNLIGWYSSLEDGEEDPAFYIDIESGDLTDREYRILKEAGYVNEDGDVDFDRCGVFGYTRYDELENISEEASERVWCDRCPGKLSYKSPGDPDIPEDIRREMFKRMEKIIKRYNIDPDECDMYYYGYWCGILALSRYLLGEPCEDGIENLRTGKDLLDT